MLRYHRRAATGFLLIVCAQRGSSFGAFIGSRDLFIRKLAVLQLFTRSEATPLWGTVCFQPASPDQACSITVDLALVRADRCRAAQPVLSCAAASV